MSVTASQKLKRAKAVVDAARAFADEQSCLDETCTHKVCVLNKTLAAFDRSMARGRR